MKHGVLVVDKPSGLSSHGVVSRVRRLARQRTVGHAGTLDPMATGVLVVMLGEATKLAAHLSADDKVYRASITLGVCTDTLDAEGEVTARAEVPALSTADVRRAAETFLGPGKQRAPRVSAVKRGGRPLYERHRRGEEFEAPLRDVYLAWLSELRYGAPQVELQLGVGKGYYVRAFARDLGDRLGTGAHLSALRRLRSGSFGLEESISLEALMADGGEARLEDALLSPADAVRHLTRAHLDREGVTDAFHGRPIRGGHFRLDGEGPGPLALLDPEGRLIGLGRRAGADLAVSRGLRY